MALPNQYYFSSHRTSLIGKYLKANKYENNSLTGKYKTLQL